ncbi:nucleoside 2-deoxyribosyltransferase [Peribacillus sp. NPDC097264]|uniref:nucleoside 2-deoxyribosyltransferase n=1 Tax=unclassified Peribacillus TaxID=2675266 RepID=UPI00381B75EE
MKYYIASDEKNIKQVKSLIKKLNAKGFSCVNEWNLFDKNGNKETTNSLGDYEKEGIDEADFMLIFLTAGKGNLYELGHALSSNKKIVVYSPEKENYHINKKSIFHNIPGAIICSGTLYKLVKLIQSLAPAEQDDPSPMNS